MLRHRKLFEAEMCIEEEKTVRQIRRPISKTCPQNGLHLFGIVKSDSWIIMEYSNGGRYWNRLYVFDRQI